MKEEYYPFGKEWQKEMMKQTKRELVLMYAKIAADKIDIKLKANNLFECLDNMRKRNIVLPKWLGEKATIALKEYE